MKSGLRMFARVVVAFSLLPALLAEDSAKPAATAKKDGAVNSGVAFGAVAKAKAAVTTSVPLLASPMPQVGAGQVESEGAASVTPKAELFLGYSFLRNAPTSAGNRLAYLHGGSTSLALNLNRHLGLVADFGGFHADRFGPNAPPTGGVEI